MINQAFFLGQPVQFGSLCKIYPPKIKDSYEEKDFYKFQSVFVISQEEIEDELLGVDRNTQVDYVPTPFEFFLGNCYNSPEFNDLAVRAFKFFTHEDVIILPEQRLVLFGKPETILENIKNVAELKSLNESNFFKFQNIIREALGQSKIEEHNANEDIRVTRIKAKARYRDKIKAKSNKGVHFGEILVSICCMDMGLNPLNIGELSYVAVNALVEKYQLKEKYDLDIKSLLAGADSKKIQPKYWIGNN